MQNYHFHMISRLKQQVAGESSIKLVCKYIGIMLRFLRVQFSRILKMGVEL